MAINPAGMVMKLDPVQGLDLTGFAKAMEHQAQLKQERERLALQRQQFEEQKRHNKEEAELRRQAEAGEAARGAMLEQRERDKAAALVTAESLDDRQLAYAKFAELQGSGELEAAEAMIPQMTAMGMGATREGADGGLPRYRITMDAKADAEQQEQAAMAQQAAEDQAWQKAPRPLYDKLDGQQPQESAVQSLSLMNSLGYPTNERGNLDDTSLESASTLTAEDVDVGAGAPPELDPDVADALMPGEADSYTPTPYAPPGGGAYGSMEEGAAHDMPEEAPAEVSVGASEPLGVATLSGQDPFARALAAGRKGRATGKPTRGRDQADAMGSVPTDVIDTGAMAMQAAQRLNPLMSGIIAGRPEAYRDSAIQTSRGLAGTGLPLGKQLEAYNTFQGAADDLVQSEIAAGLKKESKDETTPMQKVQMEGRGVKDAKDSFKTNDVQTSFHQVEAADTVLTMLENEDEYDDEKVINYLMTMTGNKGSQTENDALRMIGRGKVSSIDQLRDWIHERIAGGFSDEVRNSIAEFAHAQRDVALERSFAWLDNVRKTAESGDTHERVRAGYRRFIDDNVPDWLLDEYEASRAEEDGDAPRPVGSNVPRGGGSLGGGEDDPFQMELDTQAAANDLDPDKMRIVIGPESGGDPRATNSQSGAQGILQLMPENMAAAGTSQEELSKQTAAQQLPSAIKYLKSKGLTADSRPEDYALAVAAPAYIGKPDNVQITQYRSGTEFGDKVRAQNPGWIPPGGGEITVGSILRFYGMRGEDGGGATEPSTAEDAEVLGLLGED